MLDVFTAVHVLGLVTHGVKLAVQPVTEKIVINELNHLLNPYAKSQQWDNFCYTH